MIAHTSERAPAPSAGTVTGPARAVDSGENPTGPDLAGADQARRRLTFSHLRRLTDLRVGTADERSD